MKCKICGRFFYIKRKIEDLFKNDKYTICEECYKKYKIKLGYDVLPLNNYNLYIYSLFGKKYFLKDDPFFMEFSKLFSFVLDNNKDKVILIYTDILINEKKIELFEYLSKLNDNDLIIICNSYSIQ